MVERWTRERRLEHTRSLLLDAAEDVFAEKGFAPATLDEIASVAGYTKGAIYKHFATKEDLFLAVNDRFVAACGWSRDELVGRSGLEIGLWASSRQRDEMYAQLRAGGTLRDAMLPELLSGRIRVPEAAETAADATV